MGLTDKFKRGGGGFLNNVDGTIVGLKFTINPDFGGQDQKAAKEGAFTPLWVALTVQVDGADAAETTHLFAGSGDDFVISEDGSTLTPIEGASLWGGTAFAQFYTSAVENGLSDPEPSEEDGSMDFSHVVGARVRFVQVKDEEAMKRAAKSAGKSRGTINAQGQKKGKDGKFYDIRTLQVEKVYSEGNAVSATPAKTTGKAASGAAKPAAAKGGKKTAAAPTSDVADFAAETLVNILAKNSDGLAKTKLNLAVTRELVKDERREAVRVYLADDANLNALAEAGVITYQNGVVAAA